MSEGVGGENMCGAERITQKTPTLSLFMRKESQSIHVGVSTSETNKQEKREKMFLSSFDTIPESW